MVIARTHRNRSSTADDAPPQQAAPPAMTGAATAPQQPEPRILRSEELLRGDREIVIMHAGETYRLRITRNDKLILTK
jgi:hemin uptake protein HemP